METTGREKVIDLDTSAFGSTVRRVTIDRVHIEHTMPFTAPAFLAKSTAAMAVPLG